MILALQSFEEEPSHPGPREYRFCDHSACEHRRYLHQDNSQRGKYGVSHGVFKNDRIPA